MSKMYTLIYENTLTAVFQIRKVNRDFLGLLNSPSMLAVKAKIHGVLYKQSSSIAFDETSSYWSVLKSS